MEAIVLDSMLSVISWTFAAIHCVGLAVAAISFLCGNGEDPRFAGEKLGYRS
jgi:hypothetical protein